MRRRYSDADKATALAALDANAGNLKKTSGALRIPLATLQGWRDGRGVVDAVTDLRNGKKADLADRLEEIAHQLLDAIPGKLDDANLSNIAVSFGITIDKMRLLREQATSITSNLTDDERADRIAALLDAARARRDRPTPLHAA